MKMTFRWFGANSDPVSLQQIRQIPGMTGVMGFLDYKEAGEVWTREEIGAYVKEIQNAGLECIEVYDNYTKQLANEQSERVTYVVRKIK